LDEANSAVNDLCETVFYKKYAEATAIADEPTISGRNCRKFRQNDQKEVKKSVGILTNDVNAIRCTLSNMHSFTE